jgi:hypothetical protein
MSDDLVQIPPPPPGGMGIMRLEDLRRQFARLSYKPGWAFEVHATEHEGPELHINCTMADSTDPSAQVALNIISPLPPMRFSWQLDDWLIWRLNRIESHEVREWLQRDGKPISDPHDGVERT